VAEMQATLTLTRPVVRTEAPGIEASETAADEVAADAVVATGDVAS